MLQSNAIGDKISLCIGTLRELSPGVFLPYPGLLQWSVLTGEVILRKSISVDSDPSPPASGTIPVSNSFCPPAARVRKDMFSPHFAQHQNYTALRSASSPKQST